MDGNMLSGSSMGVLISHKIDYWWDSKVIYSLLSIYLLKIKVIKGRLASKRSHHRSDLEKIPSTNQIN